MAGLVSAGATLVRPADDEIDWTVLADPQGNEFCAFVDRPERGPAAAWLITHRVGGRPTAIVVDVRLAAATQLPADGDRLEEAHDRDRERAGEQRLDVVEGRPPRASAGRRHLGTSATPCSSRSASRTSRIPPITASSGPGMLGANRLAPSSTAIVPAENTTVVTLRSPNWSTTALMSSTKLSAVGSPGMPRSLGSWAAATVSPTPT